MSVLHVKFSPARSCGYYRQNLKVTPIVRKLNIVSVVLHLYLQCEGVEVAIATPLNAVWDMHIEGEH